MVDSVSFDSTATNNHPQPAEPSNVTVVPPGTEQVTVPDETVPEGSPESDQGRPEKFKSDEEWRKHYDELQKKYTQDQMDTTEPTKDGLEITKEPVPVGVEAMAKFTEEYTEAGSLSDASYKELETNHGLNKDMVDQHIAGQIALRDQRDGSIKDSVGGDKAYKQMGSWARTNWSEAELETFNTQINSPDVNVAMMAAKALKADYVASEGSDPSLLQGKGNSQHGEKYGSTAQVTAAMRDPRYATDPVYRREVADKLDRSTFMGTIKK